MLACREPFLAEEVVGVCGRELEGVRELRTCQMPISIACQDWSRTHSESNFSMSACEYEAPITIPDSVGFGEPCL